MSQLGGKLNEIYREGQGYYKDMRTKKGMEGQSRPYLFSIGTDEYGNDIDINERIKYFREGMDKYRKYFVDKNYVNQLFNEKYNKDGSHKTEGIDIAYFENYTRTQEKHAMKTEGRTLLFIPFMIHFSSIPWKESNEHVTLEIGESIIKPYFNSRKDCPKPFNKVQYGFYTTRRKGRIIKNLGFFRSNSKKDIDCLTNADKRDLIRAFIYSMKDYNQVKSFNEISHWGIPNPDSPTESKILLSDELKDEAARSGMISSKLMDIDNYSIDDFKDELRTYFEGDHPSRLQEIYKDVNLKINSSSLITPKKVKETIKKIRTEVYEEGERLKTQEKESLKEGTTDEGLLDQFTSLSIGDDSRSVLPISSKEVYPADISEDIVREKYLPPYLRGSEKTTSFPQGMETSYPSQIMAPSQKINPSSRSTSYKLTKKRER